jgi:hypothetical protein
VEIDLPSVASRPRLNSLLAAVRTERRKLETIKAIPCIVAFRQRHPTAGAVFGSLRVQVEVKNGRATGLGARPTGGNIDQAFSDCYSRAAEWTRAELLVPEEPDGKYAIDVNMRLGKFPPEVESLAAKLAPDWYDPERWDYSQIGGLSGPPGWEPVLKRLLKGYILTNDTDGRSRIR